eukprot:TRINITY_DN24929_c0_g4_i1.p1 TRINITY_DN24929_c0_g4~~TRINITY_DN24929_c0_g4_i1.p1  ORF type:complete len:962 (+),score=149.67 TRINITY_DN24929_c0_g4_i1:88-2886(+)
MGVGLFPSAWAEWRTGAEVGLEHYVKEVERTAAAANKRVKQSNNEQPVETPVCPFACYEPRCSSGSGHGGQRLVGGRCTHYCSDVRNGLRFCGVGANFERKYNVNCTGCAVVPPAPDLWKGMCYTPLPRKGFVTDGIKSGNFQDDYMSEDATPLWGRIGRDDLSTIRDMGANKVRMYGNNPDNDHRSFLDAAGANGLTVVAGISNFPYSQMKGNCNELDNNCFNVIKQSYAENLKKGFAVGGRYHPALDHLIVINEPELILGNGGSPAADKAYATKPDYWVKGVISAIDGILQAEQEHGITGYLIPLTPTVTFGPCNFCIGQSQNASDVKNTRPALGQMLQLADGLLNPKKYGYEPKSNLTDFYYTRLLMSCNTNNLAEEVKAMFLDYYEKEFPHMPLVFEEYHSWRAADKNGRWGYAAQKKDLTTMLNYASKSKVLKGFNFFEFQVSFDKMEDTYTESFFGIFGLGDYSIMDMDFFHHWTSVRCLQNIEFNNTRIPTVVNGTVTNKTHAIGWLPDSDGISRAVIESFGGRGIDASKFCRPDPEKVPLTAVGYSSVRSLGASCPAAMIIFISRLVNHLGGMAIHNFGLTHFAQRYCEEGASVTSRRLAAAVSRSDVHDFNQLIEELRRMPGWAFWSPYPTCVSSRSVDATSLGRMIDQLCFERVKFFDCIHIPPKCRSNLNFQADYVVSTYFDELRTVYTDPNPIEHCYFNGSAFYASSTYQYENASFMDPECVVSKDPYMTPLTDEGYAAVIRSRGAESNAIFIQRVLFSLLGNATVCDQTEFEKFAKKPSTSLWELQRDLRSYWWVCDGATGRSCIDDPCEAPGSTAFLKQKWFVIISGVTAVTLVIATILTCIYARRLPEESEVWAKKHMRRSSYMQQTSRLPLHTATGGGPPRQQAAPPMPGAFPVYNRQGQVVVPAASARQMRTQQR